MKVRRILICPSLLQRADGTAAKVGGPHCLRECRQTGKIHVAHTAQVRPDRDEADAPSVKLGQVQRRTARTDGMQAGLRHVGRF